MEIFFIVVFVVSAIATFFTPAGALGMTVLISWMISAIYLAFRYRKNIAIFINDLF